MCLNLVDVNENTIAGAEANNDLGDAEKEGLDPVLHQLPMEGVHVARRTDLDARLQLDPVDRAALLLGLRIPD